MRWAENSEEAWLNVDVEAKNNKCEVKIEADKFTYSCADPEYFVSFPLAGKVNTEKSSFAVRARGVEVRFVKEEKGYWEKLTPEQSKYKHQLKTNWDLWTNEDDEEEAKAPAADFGMGGFGDFGGLGGLGGMGGLGGADGMDFSKLLAQMNQGGDDLPGMDEDDVAADDEAEEEPAAAAEAGEEPAAAAEAADK